MSNPTSRGHRSIATSHAERLRAPWEREMRRLSVITRSLTAMLLAVCARMLITGATLTSALITAVIAALLLTAIRLRHYGRKLGPTRSGRAAPLRKHAKGHR